MRRGEEKRRDKKRGEDPEERARRPLMVIAATRFVPRLLSHPSCVTHRRCSSASPPWQILSPLWIESRSHQSLLHPSYSRARSLDRASVSPSALERTRDCPPTLLAHLLPPSFPLRFTLLFAFTPIPRSFGREEREKKRSARRFWFDRATKS